MPLQSYMQLQLCTPPQLLLTPQWLRPLQPMVDIHMLMEVITQLLMPHTLMDTTIKVKIVPQIIQLTNRFYSFADWQMKKEQKNLTKSLTSALIMYICIFVLIFMNIYLRQTQWWTTIPCKYTKKGQNANPKTTKQQKQTQNHFALAFD